MPFEIAPPSLNDLGNLLTQHGVTEALIKPLSRNHNDKNQIYSGSDFSPLYPMFEFNFSLRGASTSSKKGGRTTGKAIPEATFRSFTWLNSDGREIAAREVKMIIY